MKKIYSGLFLLLVCGVANADIVGQLDTQLRFNKIDHMGIPVHVESSHRVNITNNGNNVRTVNAYYNVCMNVVCTVKKITGIKINPHASWTNEISLEMNPYVVIPTIYEVTAITRVTDEHGADVIKSSWQHGEMEVRQ